MPPYSQTVVEGGQVELRCHPPPGRPAPALSWTRDGQPVQGSNFLQAADGHLIVVQASQEDAGNYRWACRDQLIRVNTFQLWCSCVAENRANRRISAPARLTVTRAGWAGWGEWGECSAHCGPGQQRRLRECRGVARGVARGG